MAGPLFFAWVNAGDDVFSPAFAREDEDVFDIKINHFESEYPTATILIRNPGTGLLAPGRKQYAWISFADTNTSGLVPLFFGRVAGQAVSIGSKVIQIMLRARPRDMQDQKLALAAALKVAPYWDPLWIRPELRDDPETVLESRTAVWHYDRVSPTVSVSDIIDGEDGSETFTTDDYFADTLSTSIGEQPLRNVEVVAEVSWTQKASGSVDISQSIIDAFHAAGSQKAGLISSFTGEGLWDDWPEVDDNIGGGWFVKDTLLTRCDGVSVPLEYSKTKCEFKEEPDPTEKDPPRGYTVRLALWQIRAYFLAGYDVERSKRETVKFTLSADVQPLWTDADDSETEQLSFSSNDVGELIDDEGTSAVMPIMDLRRRQFFPTDRGLRSIEYLIMVARAHLLARGRAATVSIDITFERAIELSCRKNATIYNDELPGGVASGKIVGYSFGINEGGERFGSVTIACSVGLGNSVAGVDGISIYDDDYAASDYGEIENNVNAVGSGDVTYVPPSDAPNDDGVDFFNMTAANSLLACYIRQGGETSQRTILNQQYRLVADAVETLNNDYTILDIVLRPLAGKSFEQTYNVEVSSMMIPKTIDLES